MRNFHRDYGAIWFTAWTWIATYALLRIRIKYIILCISNIFHAIIFLPNRTFYGCFPYFTIYIYTTRAALTLLCWLIFRYARRNEENPSANGFALLKHDISDDGKRRIYLLFICFCFLFYFFSFLFLFSFIIYSRENFKWVTRTSLSLFCMDPLFK